MIVHLFLATAVAALGDQAPARFVIERIEVRNAQRVSPRLIADETQLREGREYSEEDVRDAMARLTRLPFLLKAESALEPGSDAARRILVVNVTEMRRLSYLLDARGIQLDQGFKPTFDYDFADPTSNWANAAAGVRWLSGGGGMAHFGLTVLRNRNSFAKNYSAWELGYTQHDIFRTRAFATVIARSPVDSLEEKTFTPEVLVGLPLTANQTLTLDVEDTLFRRDTFTVLGTKFDRLQAERLVTAAWTYDTTNQPYAPSRGTLVRIAPMRYMQDHASFQSIPGSFVPTAGHVNANGVDVVALRYWPLSDVHTVSAGVLGGWADVENRERRTVLTTAQRHSSYEILQGGYSRPLGAARVGIEGRLVTNQTGAPSFGDDEDHSFEVAANWTRRGAWGTLRLGVGYAHSF